MRSKRRTRVNNGPTSKLSFAFQHVNAVKTLVKSEAGLATEPGRPSCTILRTLPQGS